MRVGFAPRSVEIKPYVPQICVVTTQQHCCCWCPTSSHPRENCDPLLTPAAGISLLQRQDLSSSSSTCSPGALPAPSHVLRSSRKRGLEGLACAGTAPGLHLLLLLLLLFSAMFTTPMFLPLASMQQQPLRLVDPLPSWRVPGHPVRCCCCIIAKCGGAHPGALWRQGSCQSAQCS